MGVFALPHTLVHQLGHEIVPQTTMGRTRAEWDRPATGLSSLLSDGEGGSDGDSGWGGSAFK